MCETGIPSRIIWEKKSASTRCLFLRLGILCRNVKYSYFFFFILRTHLDSSILSREARENFKYLKKRRVFWRIPSVFFLLFHSTTPGIASRESRPCSRRSQSCSSLSASVLLVAKIDGRIGPSRRVFWYTLSLGRTRAGGLPDCSKCSTYLSVWILIASVFPVSSRFSSTLIADLSHAPFIRVISSGTDELLTLSTELTRKRI